MMSEYNRLKEEMSGYFIKLIDIKDSGYKYLIDNYPNQIQLPRFNKGFQFVPAPTERILLVSNSVDLTVSVKRMLSLKEGEEPREIWVTLIITMEPCWTLYFTTERVLVYLPMTSSAGGFLTIIAAHALVRNQVQYVQQPLSRISKIMAIKKKKILGKSYGFSGIEMHFETPAGVLAINVNKGNLKKFKDDSTLYSFLNLFKESVVKNKLDVMNYLLGKDGAHTVDETSLHDDLKRAQKKQFMQELSEDKKLQYDMVELPSIVSNTELYAHELINPI